MLGGLGKAVVKAVGGLVDQLVPDSDLRAKLKQELESKAMDIESMVQKGEIDIKLAQIGVNQAEAAHRSIFVAGWRPCVGWTCAAALAYNLIGREFIIFIASFQGHDLSGLPAPDLSIMLTVLLGMLGLGGMRSWEKKQGLTK